MASRGTSDLISLHRKSRPGSPWNLVDGWLRVEYQNAAGAWVGITNGVVALGFARGLASPTKPVGGGAGSNPVHPNAILIFQQQADRDASGTLTNFDNPRNISEAAGATQYSWYPINLYDPREGFPRDAAPAGMANPFCYVNGIMNAVEFDVGNFRKWLLGTDSRGKRAIGLVQQPERLPGVLLRPPRHAARPQQWQHHFGRIWVRRRHQLGLAHRNSGRGDGSELRTSIRTARLSAGAQSMSDTANE